jgi:hypothetical protein
MDQTAAKPPTWREWKARHGRWAWPLSFEWAAEWVVYWSRHWDFVKALELAGQFTLLLAVISWFWEAGDRQKTKHYRAWELINSARGSTGDGGRRYALQDLNEDRIPLIAAPLAKAFLDEIDLPGANLRSANLSGASLSRANLSGASLVGAIVGRFPLDRPLEWLPPGWEVVDSKGTARLRRN